MQLVKKILEKEKFNPNLLGLFLNPFYFSRHSLYEGIEFFSSSIKGNVLDVGCGCKPYKNLFKLATSYVGMDVKNSGHNHYDSKVDVFYDGKKFPFKNCEFDGLVSFEVLEHVFNPKVFLSEVNRVLKKHGKLLITVPFIWDEHEQPYDFARYSSFGLKYLLKQSGFRIIKSKKTGNDISVIFQLLNTYFYKSIIKHGNKFEICVDLMVASMLNLIGFLFRRIFPKNNDLYLDNIILAVKI